MQHHTNRILLLSLRQARLHVSRLAAYEFEDVICAVDHADLIMPTQNDGQRGSRLFKLMPAGIRNRALIRRCALRQDYDLFFFVCHNPLDLLWLRSIKNWRKHCRKAVCWLIEAWGNEIDRFKKNLELLQEMDCIFVGLSQSVNPIARLLKRSCHFLPFGVDTLRFCPFPMQAERPIDVLNVGRRCSGTHRSLLDLSRSVNLAYIYDTVTNFSVLDFREHRDLYSNLIKRSRYFLVNKAKFDAPAVTGGQEEFGPRFYEGAAGGAVLLGGTPACAEFRAHFDWEDAVIQIPDEASGIGGLIADLNRQPERLDSIRLHNVVHSLLHHDWLYRWEVILQSAGLPETLEMQSRRTTLQDLADRVQNQRVDPVQKALEKPCA